MNKIGFDSKMYMQKQTEHILERINRFDKLYLEFGGKLFDDLHAARVLPGFDKAAKIKLLQKLRDKAELIIVSTQTQSSATKCAPTTASHTAAKWRE